MYPQARSRHVREVALILLTLTFVAFGAGALAPAHAGQAENAQALVDRSRITLEEFLADEQMGPPLRSLLQRAQAVLIYPQVLRGAFVVGASGGSGTLVAQDAKTKDWAGPAFYTIGQASVGIQAGGDASQIVLVALTERGLTNLLTTSVTLGGNASVALGPVGAGAAAATAGLSADIVSYSRARGAFAGISLEGAVVATRGRLNQAYFGKDVSPTDILVRRTVKNKNASGLLNAVKKAATAG
jgi:lipid-binding SYLF domain-containing protein